MKIYQEIGLQGFDAWSGAVDTQQTIINEGLSEEFDAMIEELYPDGLSETGLNDILWFESDWIYESLGIQEDDEEYDEDEE